MFSVDISIIQKNIKKKILRAAEPTMASAPCYLPLTMVGLSNGEA